MLKSFICTLSFVAIGLPALANTGVHGDRNLSLWTGQYQVTQCVQCDDVKTDDTNLKNLSLISIYSFPIAPKDRLDCGTVDMSVGVATKFVNPDGSTSEMGPSSGQCDWDDDEYLNVTETTFEYQTLGHSPSGEAYGFLATKQADGSILIDIKVSRKFGQAWGFPQAYGLKVIAKKIN